MGREIRRVLAGWEHPKQPCTHSPWAGGCSEARMTDGRCYHPLFDKDFETEARKWMDATVAWDKREYVSPYGLEITEETYRKHPFFWQYDGEPPDPKYYRPKWSADEMTHYQVYETVSEGTPISPVFATEDEMIEWLVNDGGYDGPHSRKSAEAFVKSAWAPSMIIGPEGIKMGVDSCE